ncbi:MAG: DNA translocase FtsK 4TM domain-containing protein, partial [Selenomonadaceae bacterium]|nr:DNA translocase FtsK 4TM domain-containing protein [Selenomonadaceae bacterium]
MILKRKSAGRKVRKKEPKLASANTERRYELLGIGIFVAGLLALAGSFGWNAGFVGGHFSKFLHYFFGVGTIPVIFVILLIGLQYITKHHGIVYSLRFFGMTTFFVSLLAIYHHFTIAPGAEILPESLPQGGGLLGGGALLLLRKFFGVDGGLIVLGAGVVGSVLLFTKWSLGNGLLKTKDKAVQGASAAGTAIAATYGHVAEV